MANAIIQPIKAASTPEDMRLTPNSTFIRVYGMILLAEKMFQGCVITHLDRDHDQSELTGETFSVCKASKRKMREHLLQSPRTLGIPLPNVTSSSTEQDDTLLVAASKRGDQDAFAQLVQRYQRRVFNLVFRMLQQYEEANEITQETFLAAWQGLPS